MIFQAGGTREAPLAFLAIEPLLSDNTSHMTFLRFDVSGFVFSPVFLLALFLICQTNGFLFG